MRFAIIFFAAIVGGYLVASVGETGPGCPGNPEWLGWCSEVAP